MTVKEWLLKWAWQSRGDAYAEVKRLSLCRANCDSKNMILFDYNHRYTRNKYSI